MTITPLYAGILAVSFFVLSIRVVAFRRQGISLGDGGNPSMLRRIRGHGNFAEYVPFILLMMGFLEFSHFSSYLLHGLGIVLVVARLLHGYALSFTDKFFFGRFMGTVLTFTLLNVCGLLCLYQGLQAILKTA
ncbi:MAG TPA: MAPEG family protein [Burkholderiales bacterium]|nr:MAPEG family protein [Burkholderiales bacterium]